MKEIKLKRNEVYLVRERDVRAGRFGVLWKIFQSERFTGRFLISGDAWQAEIHMVDGVLPGHGLVYRDEDGRATGKAALGRLKNRMRRLTGLRFSIAVPL